MNFIMATVFTVFVCSTVHNGCPKTVIWQTMMLMFMPFDVLPPIASRVLRCSSIIEVHKDLDGNSTFPWFTLQPSYVLFIDSFDTSAHYTVSLRLFTNTEIEVCTSYANASRIIRSGIYANWYRQHRPVKMIHGTNREAMSSLFIIIFYFFLNLFFLPKPLFTLLPALDMQMAAYDRSHFPREQPCESDKLSSGKYND